MLDGQAGTYESYEGRGVWVPRGLTAAQIMCGARVLERDFGVAPFISRAMVSAILAVSLPDCQAEQSGSDTA